MPRMDGLELCRRVRARSDSLPLIFLTSRDDEFDRVLGLELGADDYLCKPFSMRELLARVKVLFRRLALLQSRAEVSASSSLRVAGLILDLDRYSVSWNGDAVPLTPNPVPTEHQGVFVAGSDKGTIRSEAYEVLRPQYPKTSFFAQQSSDERARSRPWGTLRSA